jgi:hypothetical protein
LKPGPLPEEWGVFLQSSVAKNLNSSESTYGLETKRFQIAQILPSLRQIRKAGQTILRYGAMRLPMRALIRRLRAEDNRHPAGVKTLTLALLRYGLPSQPFDS